MAVLRSFDTLCECCGRITCYATSRVGVGVGVGDGVRVGVFVHERVRDVRHCAVLSVRYTLSDFIDGIVLVS